MEAANNLGVVLMQAGRTEQAILMLQAALKIKPDYQEAIINLDKILEDQQNNSLKKSSVKKKPQNPEGMMNRKGSHDF